MLYLTVNNITNIPQHRYQSYKEMDTLLIFRTHNIN